VKVRATRRPSGRRGRGLRIPASGGPCRFEGAVAGRCAPRGERAGRRGRGREGPQASSRARDRGQPGYPEADQNGAFTSLLGAGSRAPGHLKTSVANIRVPQWLASYVNIRPPMQAESQRVKSSSISAERQRERSPHWVGSSLCRRGASFGLFVSSKPSGVLVSGASVRFVALSLWQIRKNVDNFLDPALPTADEPNRKRNSERQKDET